jgi:hypothetical protein
MNNANVVPLNGIGGTGDDYVIQVGSKQTKDDIPGEAVTYHPNNASNYFTSITGKSGSGKTFLIRKLINELNNTGQLTTIIIDTQGDFSPQHFEEYLPGSSARLNHNSFDYIESPVNLNPFKITLTGSNSDYIFAAKNVIEAIKCFNPSLGSQQESLLNQIVTKAYGNAGIDPNIPDTWKSAPPTIDSVLEIAQLMQIEVEGGLSESVISGIRKTVKRNKSIKGKIDAAGGLNSDMKSLQDKQDEEKDNLKESICNLIDSDDPSIFSSASTTPERISSICNTLLDMQGCGIFGEDTISIKQKRINVIDISELHPTTYPTLIHLILYRTFQSSVLVKKRSGNVGNRLSTLLVFDEGKIFAASAGNNMSPLKRIIEEGRKFGLGGIFGLQNARQIPAAFLSNIATSFVLPVSHNDISATASVYQLDKDVLRHLVPKKQALFASDTAEHFLIET